MFILGSDKDQGNFRFRSNIIPPLGIKYVINNIRLVDYFVVKFRLIFPVNLMTSSVF